jgi:hypothetical protein
MDKFDENALQTPGNRLDEESTIGKNRKAQIDFCKGEKSPEDLLFAHLCDTDKKVKKELSAANEIVGKSARKVKIGEIRKEALQGRSSDWAKLKDFQKKLTAIGKKFRFNKLYQIK